jgi:hypothetical protein
LVSRPDGRTQFDNSFTKGCWKEYVNTEDEVTRNLKSSIIKSLEISSPQNIVIIHEDNKGSLWES